MEEQIGKVKGVVDTKDGLVYAGPSLSLRPRFEELERFGLTASDLAAAVNTAMLGQTASSVLEGDRVIAIRVMVDRSQIDRVANLRELPLRTPDGTLVKLSQVANIEETPGQLELHREDLRQNVAVTARLEGRDLGSAIADIQKKLSLDKSIPPGTIEYGGLYKQQQDSFRNLVLVLALAILLVFTVLLIEFGSFYEPVAIVFGAVLAMFGTVLGLWITGTTLNVVSFLGAIIGVGIVAKNGILMLDFVEHLRAEGASLEDALVRSGHRRLRPVLMTSMAAAFGMLPLAYGIGSGADMLKPLAIAVIGALCISVLLSLVATPTVYFLLRRAFGNKELVHVINLMNPRTTRSLSRIASFQDVRTPTKLTPMKTISTVLAVIFWPFSAAPALPGRRCSLSLRQRDPDPGKSAMGLPASRSRGASSLSLARYKVDVIDLDKGVVIGAIEDTPGVHGMAVVPKLGRAFTSNGQENKASIVDMQTLKTISKVSTGANPDSILYEAAQNEVYTFNGKGKSATVFDPQSGKVTATIDLGGKPESAAADSQAGQIYVNIEDKSEVAVIDIKTHKVINHWPIAPGESASGMAIDLEHHRLFLGCDNKKMVMMDSRPGKSRPLS